MTTRTSPRLVSELAAVRGELVRIDGKAGTLAGLDGAGLAFLATQISHGPLAVQVILGAAGLTLAAAALTLLLCVLRPRLGDTGFRRYHAISLSKIQELLEDVAEGPAESEMEDLQILSRITNHKYLRLRTAIDLSAAAVALIGIGLVTGMVVT